MAIRAKSTRARLFGSGTSKPPRYSTIPGASARIARLIKFHPDTARLSDIPQLPLSNSNRIKLHNSFLISHKFTSVVASVPRKPRASRKAAVPPLDLLLRQLTHFRTSVTRRIRAWWYYMYSLGPGIPKRIYEMLIFSRLGFFRTHPPERVQYMVATYDQCYYSEYQINDANY